MRSLHCCVIALLCLIGTGCQLNPIHMSVPSSLTKVEPLPVKRAWQTVSNPSMAIGSWKTTRLLKKDIQNRCSRHLATVDSIGVEPYEFTIAEDKSELRATCETKTSTRLHLVGNFSEDLDNHPQLDCGFQGPGTGNLHLETQPRGNKVGNIDFGDATWEIRSVDVDDRGHEGSFGPLGYEVTSDGKAIAAIEVINNGRVWMDPGLSPENQLRLAGIAGALFMHGPGEVYPGEGDCEDWPFTR